MANEVLVGKIKPKRPTVNMSFIDLHSINSAAALCPFVAPEVCLLLAPGEWILILF